MKIAKMSTEELLKHPDLNWTAEQVEEIQNTNCLYWEVPEYGTIDAVYDGHIEPTGYMMDGKLVGIEYMECDAI